MTVFKIDITPGPDGRFGFTIVGDSPLMVEESMPGGPAARSGLKVNDYVMEVNGIPVKHHETAAAMIKAAQGRPLRLGVLSMARRPKRLSSSMRVLSQSGDSIRESRAHKAMEFNKKVNVKLLLLFKLPCFQIMYHFDIFFIKSGGGGSWRGARCEGAPV